MRRCAYAECGKTEATSGNFFPCVLCVHEEFPHPNYYCSERCEILEFKNRHKHSHKKAEKAPAGSDLFKDYFQRKLRARSKDLQGPANIHRSVEPNPHNQIPDIDSACDKNKKIVVTKVHSSKDLKKEPDFSLRRCAYSKCESTELGFSCNMCTRTNKSRYYCSLRCKNMDFLDGHMYKHRADSSVGASFYERLQSAVSQDLDFDTDPEEPVVYNVVNSIDEAEEQGAVGGAKMVNLIIPIDEPDLSLRRCAFADCEKQEEFHGEFLVQCHMCFLNLQPRYYCSPGCQNKDFLNGHWRAHEEAFHEPRHSCLRCNFFITLNIALKELVGNTHNAVNSHDRDQHVETVQSSVNSTKYSEWAEYAPINREDPTDVLQCATKILSLLRCHLNQTLDLSIADLPELMGRMVKTISADLLDVTGAEEGTNTFDMDGCTAVVLEPHKDASLIQFIEEMDRVAGALSEQIDIILSEDTTRVGDEQIDSLHRCAYENCERVALFPCYPCVLRQERNPKYFCGPLCESLESKNGRGHQHKDPDYWDVCNKLEEGQPGAVDGENDGCPPISVDKEEEEETNNGKKKRTTRGQSLGSRLHRRRCETCGVQDSRSSPTRHKACPLCYEIFKDGLPFQMQHRKR